MSLLLACIARTLTLSFSLAKAPSQDLASGLPPAHCSSLTSTPPANYQTAKTTGLMNIGFRPRLKARPSLYDLIRNRNIEQLSVQPLQSSTEELPLELPPLPSSPASTFSSPPTPVKLSHPDPPQQPDDMAPKKAPAKDADGEDQYGMSQLKKSFADSS